MPERQIDSAMSAAAESTAGSLSSLDVADAERGHRTTAPNDIAQHRDDHAYRPLVAHCRLPRESAIEEAAARDYRTRIPDASPSCLDGRNSECIVRGATAVVRSVTPGAEPDCEFLSVRLGQLVEIGVERCEGSEPQPVNPLYPLATAQDHYTGAAEMGSGTLSSRDVAPRECAAGPVQVRLPEESTPAWTGLTGTPCDEVARWAAS